MSHMDSTKAELVVGATQYKTFRRQISTWTLIRDDGHVNRGELTHQNNPPNSFKPRMSPSADFYSLRNT